MNQYLTFEYLESYKKPIIVSESNAYSPKTKVFLSHRHSEDINLIEKVRFFLNLKVLVYILIG